MPGYLAHLIRVSDRQNSESSGEIAVGTNSVERAVYYLEQQGVSFDRNTADYQRGALQSICLKSRPAKVVIRIVQK